MNMFMPIPRKQQGAMLLEALISILIFSIGILAIIGLQATSIKMSSDAKYRTDASMLANQQLSFMWADIASATNAATAAIPTPFDPLEFVSYANGGTNFSPWYNNIAATLPNASATVATNTILSCNNAPCPASPTGVLQTTRTDVILTINWQAPGENVHTYKTTALISSQKQLL
jgi:type IV pilus assembly protein PilV